jgi:hypothetical protein
MTSGLRYDERSILRCVVCGAEIRPALARLGSLRCHDCRDHLGPATDADSNWARSVRLLGVLRGAIERGREVMRRLLAPAEPLSPDTPSRVRGRGVRND